MTDFGLHRARALLRAAAALRCDGRSRQRKRLMRPLAPSCHQTQPRGAPLSCLPRCALFCSLSVTRPTPTHNTTDRRRQPPQSDHLEPGHRAPRPEEERDDARKRGAVDEREAAHVARDRRRQHQVLAEDAREQVVQGEAERRDGDEDLEAQQAVARVVELDVDEVLGVVDVLALMFID